MVINALDRSAWSSRFARQCLMIPQTQSHLGSTGRIVNATHLRLRENTLP